MKVSLVVAAGVHEGKVIPIPIPQFLIGRDEVCQLRPSSPAISKKHCSIVTRAGKVFLSDFGSTNGTFVNDEPVVGEVEVKADDKIRVGPLEFVLKVERPLSPSRMQPKPSSSTAARTPAPAEDSTKEEHSMKKPAIDEESEAEQLAAMLLGTDDGPSGPITEENIPSGSTVFEMPSVAGADPTKKADAKKAPEVDNSKRAADILRKYMQRPRT